MDDRLNSDQDQPTIEEYEQDEQVDNGNNNNNGDNQIKEDEQQLNSGGNDGNNDDGGDDQMEEDEQQLNSGSNDGNNDDADDGDEDESQESDENETPLEKLKKKMKKKSIHGIHAKNLIEKITRIKIQSHPYWKEKCIGLNEESLVDRAMALESFGGTFGGNKQPTHFLCLLYKMLQIQPEYDIIKEFIMNTDFKYVRILGAFYLRLTGKPIEIYTLLEPLYCDYRALRKKGDLGNIKVHVDEFIQELLTTNYSCDIALPHLPTRYHLEQQGLLKERESPLVELGLINLKDIEKEEYDKILAEKEKENRNKNSSNSSGDKKERDRDRNRDTRRDRDRSRSTSKSPKREDKKRNRSLSPSSNSNSNNNNSKNDNSSEEELVKKERSSKKKKDISKYEKQSSSSSSSSSGSSNNQPKQKTQQDEIEEMNALRAKLGLKPLKQ